jgi:hypothetical protein
MCMREREGRGSHAALIDLLLPAGAMAMLHVGLHWAAAAHVPAPSWLAMLFKLAAAGC